MLGRASKPPNVPDAIGTPIAGKTVWAAIAPGSAAAIPAAAMISLYPFSWAVRENSITASGVR